jgi:hypothetical protein
VRRLVAAGAAVALGTLGALAVPSPALAAPGAGMVLRCVEGLVLTRANGSSWWGLAADGSPDGTRYVTTHLLVAGLDGSTWFEHSYGVKRGLASATCTSRHGPYPEEDFPGVVWTVQLARTA